MESYIKSKVVGNPDLFVLLSKTSNHLAGFKRITRAMDTGTGCIVQVTHKQLNNDCACSLTESLVFVPNVGIIQDINGGNKLAPILVPSSEPPVPDFNDISSLVDEHSWLSVSDSINDCPEEMESTLCFYWYKDEIPSMDIKKGKDLDWSRLNSYKVA